MNIDCEYPFTAEQFHELTQEQRQAILAVADYLTESTPEITDEGLSEALNLMKPTEGCIPGEEIDEDPVAELRRKFAAIKHHRCHLIWLSCCSWPQHQDERILLSSFEFLRQNV